MTPEQKSNWVNALRSGEYLQSRNVLRDANGFCCLGVYCDISNLGRWSGMGGYFVYEHADTRASGSVPQTMSEDALRRVPDLKDRSNNAVAWDNLNDDDHLTFSQIADLVEYFIEAA